MSNPRKPLSNYVPWSRVASELGIHARTVGLPAATPCPFCQGMMRVHRDPLLEGEWFHCPTCKRQGDMIELASAAWKLKIPEAVTRLRRLGFELPDSGDAVSMYVKQHVEYRRRLQELWDSARSRLDESRTLLRLTHHLGLTCEVSETRHVNGPATMIRGSDAVTVERCFAPGAMKHADARPQRHNPSERALFRGSGWGDVLLVPFYDLPWRICAYACMGRDGNPEKDIVFKRANLGPHRCFGAEAGLAMHAGVLEVSERWDNTVIAMGDLLTACRLQMRHLEQSLHPLPLVVWHDSRDYPHWHPGSHRVRTRDAWGILESREIVFWMPNPSLATFEQAIRTDGMIATVGPRSFDADSLQEYIWKYSPEDLAKHIQVHAKPWPGVLSDYLDSLSGPAIEQALLRLQAGGENVEEIVKRLPHRTQLRVARVRSASEPSLSISYEGKTIVERGDQWHVLHRNGKSELIMNAILRIDAIVRSVERKETHYAGRVIYKGQEVSFCVRRESIEGKTCDWIDELLMDKTLAYLHFNPSWSRKVVHIARFFQEPAVILGAERVGYDVQKSQFVLPGFTIDVGGEVIRSKYPLFPEPVPAASLSEPEALSGEELSRPAQLCGRGGAEVFWAMIASVLANVLAPAFRRPTQGIALRGRTANHVGKAVARALGCVEYRPDTATQVSETLQAEHEHGWPVVLEALPTLQRRYRRQLFEPQDDNRRNCIATVDFVAAKLLAINGGWYTISTEHDGGICAETLAVAKLLIPAYLKNLSERRFDLGDDRDTSTSLVTLVVQDLAEFVKARYGDEEDVLSAGRAIAIDDAKNRAEALADLLVHFIETQRLEIRESETARRKPALLEVEHDRRKGLVVPFSVLGKLTAQSDVASPSPDHLHRVLEEAEVLLDEHEDGPVIQREWFDERRRMSRVARSGLLKVHG